MFQAIGRITNKHRRVFVLLVMGWSAIFVYEAVRQVVHIGDLGSLESSEGGHGHFIKQRGIKQQDIKVITKSPLGDENSNKEDEEDVIWDDFKLEGGFEEAANVISESSHQCKNVTRPRHVPPLLYDKWHVFTSPLHEVYIYSVFYDERIDNGLFPSLRVLAVARTIKNATYCQVWYPNVTHPVVKDLIVRKNGGGHSFNKTKYEQYYFTCGLDTSYPLPNYVSVVASPCEQATNLIPIFVPIRKPFKHEFAVCVPVAFDTVDSYRLSEWVEANKILGVTEINVYHVAMSNETLRVLRHYEKQGLVKLHHIPSVPHYEKNRSGHKIGSPISLNDCMYRNMYTYKWIIVIDFDELIVPRKQKNYKDLLTAIDKDEKLKYPAPSYTFRNTYFWTGCGAQNKRPAHSYILRYLLREQPNKFLYASKSIVDPRRCISVFNHYCYIRFPLRDKKEKWTIDVKPSLSTSHHYRNLYSGKKSKNKCEDLKKNGTVDDVMLRWKKDLTKKIEKAWKDLKL